MIDSFQFRQCIIAPCLKKVTLYSKDAEELLIATVAHESVGGRYLVQKNDRGIYQKGALGVYQMEQATHDDIWKNYLAHKKELAEAIMLACNFKNAPIAYEMVWNLQYATLMARAHYLRFKEPLPSFDDLNGIWKYYKEKWNTVLGSAKKQSFIVNYLSFVGESYEKPIRPTKDTKAKVALCT